MKIPPHVDYSEDADMKKTLKQIAGTAAAVGTVALLPVEAPVVLVATISVGVGMAAAKGVGALWDLIFE
jgi:hypothetical protein